jgi:hypothetical protein
MRWFKADFQVNTPEGSKHWAYDDLRLGNFRRPEIDSKVSEHGIQDKARTFLRRCHELELQIIGITDHNFSEELDTDVWLLTQRLRQNKSVAQEQGRKPFHLFPGSEADIGYHVLWLFETATKVNDLMRVNSGSPSLGWQSLNDSSVGFHYPFGNEVRQLASRNCWI